jgi:hypothetical protein
VAVSPIIGGKTIKGPAAKMFLELGMLPGTIELPSIIWIFYPVW